MGWNYQLLNIFQLAYCNNPFSTVKEITVLQTTKSEHNSLQKKNRFPNMHKKRGSIRVSTTFLHF